MRILLISYYFPPSGGAAVQRWLRFIRYLVQRDIEVAVVCSEGGDYPFKDASLLAKVPTSVRIIRAKAPRMEKLWTRLNGKSSKLPYGDLPRQQMSFLARTLVFIRLNFIIPDLRIFWNRNAVQATLAELRSRPYDAIISTGPPHSSHLIAYQLKRQVGIKWFTDFRDPWLDIHYLKLNPPSALTRAIHAYWERKVLSSANGNFIISEAIAQALPPASKTVLYNGFDPTDFAHLQHQPSPLFRIKYIGQLTAGQDLRLILNLCAQLKPEFEFSLIGTKLSVDDTEMLQQELQHRFRQIDFLPHHEALQEMVDSDLLLLLVNDYEGNQGMLTTKLFEYLAARSPILCFGPADGAAARILEDSQAGKTFAADQLQDAVIWVNSLVPGQRTNGNIDSYSVAAQIDILIRGLQS